MEFLSARSLMTRSLMSWFVMPDCMLNPLAPRKHLLKYRLCMVFSAMGPMHELVVFLMLPPIIRHGMSLLSSWVIWEMPFVRTVMSRFTR